MALPVKFSARGATTISESKGLQQGQTAANVTPLSNQADYWDPYDVWLNRVQKPREQSAAGAAKPVAIPTRNDGDRTRT